MEYSVPHKWENKQKNIGFYYFRASARFLAADPFEKHLHFCICSLCLLASALESSQFRGYFCSSWCLLRPHAQFLCSE